VFTTGWGEPIYPDTVTSLMTKLIPATTCGAPARHHFALRRPGSRRRGQARACGPGYHTPDLRPRHPLTESAAADIFAEAVERAC
jgi:hypothetical protein